MSNNDTPGNENANLHGWRFLRYILGGPGRNRTAGTRIFKTRVLLFCFIDVPDSKP